MENEFALMECILDGARGIYIPQAFAQNFDVKEWGIGEEDEKILLDGPDNELYWEVWDDVVRNAVYDDPQTGTLWNLYQDGDLFAVVYSEEY